MKENKKTEEKTSEVVQQKQPQGQQLDPNLNASAMAINEQAIAMNKSYELIYNTLSMAIRENQQLIAKDKVSQVRIKELESQLQIKKPKSKKVIKKR